MGPEVKLTTILWSGLVAHSAHNTRCEYVSCVQEPAGRILQGPNIYLSSTNFVLLASRKTFGLPEFKPFDNLHRSSKTRFEVEAREK